MNNPGAPEEVLQHLNPPLSSSSFFSSLRIKPVSLLDIQILLPAFILLCTLVLPHLFQYESFERLLFFYDRTTQYIHKISAPSTYLSMGPGKRPHGIKNPGQSCYQNSVVQGFASIQSLQPYLQTVSNGKPMRESTAAALNGIITWLNSPKSPSSVAMPRKLSCMRVDEQQDAQEYYIKVVDAIDEEAVARKKKSKEITGPGLNNLVGKNEKSKKQELPESPFSGTLGHLLACTVCGYTEGMTMEPSTYLPLVMPRVRLGRSAPLADLLDDYCRPEQVDDVTCPKCTANAHVTRLERLLSRHTNVENEATAMVRRRLKLLKQALADNKLTDETLYSPTMCAIAEKFKSKTAKVKQVGISRPPKALVVHINRSIYNEYTDVSQKNNASLDFPEALDLGPWTVPAASNQASLTNGRRSILRGASSRPSRWQYALRATVVHGGWHSFGHYICNRRYPHQPIKETGTKKRAYKAPFEETSRWWKLSDETVFASSEERVLGDGNVFMLFYELREEEDLMQKMAESTQLPDADSEEETFFKRKRSTKHQKLESPKAVNSSAATVHPSHTINGSTKRDDKVGNLLRNLGKMHQANKDKATEQLRQSTPEPKTKDSNISTEPQSTLTASEKPTLVPYSASPSPSPAPDEDEEEWEGFSTKSPNSPKEQSPPPELSNLEEISQSTEASSFNDPSHSYIFSSPKESSPAESEPETEDTVYSSSVTSHERIADQNEIIESKKLKRDREADEENEVYEERDGKRSRSNSGGSSHPTSSASDKDSS